MVSVMLSQAATGAGQYLAAVAGMLLTAVHRLLKLSLIHI